MWDSCRFSFVVHLVLRSLVIVVILFTLAFALLNLTRATHTLSLSLRFEENRTVVRVVL